MGTKIKKVKLPSAQKKRQFNESIAKMIKKQIDAKLVKRTNKV